MAVHKTTAEKLADLDKARLEVLKKDTERNQSQITKLEEKKATLAERIKKLTLQDEEIDDKITKLKASLVTTNDSDEG